MKRNTDYTMDREVAVRINNYENYFITTYGRVINNKTGKELFGRPNLGGYIQVGLYDRDGVLKWFLVHRLVAETFIPNITGSEEVDHIDGNKLNNDVRNLRWVTSSENKRNITKGSRKSHPVRRIVQCTIEGEVVREWSSASEVERETGYCSVCILWCCKGVQKTAYGYKWEYDCDRDDYTKGKAAERYVENREKRLKYQSDYERKNRLRRTEYKRRYRAMKRARSEADEKQEGLW